MEFDVPRGDSAVCHIKVHPEEPNNGQAQPWKMTVTSGGRRDQEVKSLDIWFSKNSNRRQRQSERMILVFSIADDVQTNRDSWRFTHGGVMFCKDAGDYLNSMNFDMSDDGTILTATVKCLTDIEEKFNFSFLALHRDNRSGECSIYSSEDPGGSNGRR